MFKAISGMFQAMLMRADRGGITRPSPQTLRQAQGTLACLMQREEAALCKIEALLGWLTDPARQVGLGHDTIAVMADELALRRVAVAHLERQILQQRHMLAGLEGAQVPQNTPVKAEGWVARLGEASVVQLGDVRRRRMLAI
jgi:hypothetical protein